MVALKCKMCGGDLTITDGSTVCECEFCGTLQTIPTADNEKKMNLFARANRLRFNNEFDKASGVYEGIIADFPEEAEAYWGLVLCKYGIEYVDDPATAKKIPTCHRSSFESIFDDNNYELVMEYADAVSKRVYREEAKQIEDLRKGIIAVSANEKPYDIFICYKETDENGERTLDSVLAQDIYDALTSKGYRVFFSRITLEDKLGVEYEPYIFAALHSAKVMLAVGTDYEYYDAVWVKNEWSRYLQLIASGEKKTLIPVYKNLDAYDMPKEFARLQAQDMGKVGALQDLLRGIDKIIGKDNKKEETKVIDSGLSALNAQTQALLKRGNMALEDGDYTKANDFFEQVLNNDAESGEAYWGKVLCEYKANTPKQMADKLLNKITNNETGKTKELSADYFVLAKETDTENLLSAFDDKELSEILEDSGFLSKKITVTDYADCYQEKLGEYNSAESLTELMNSRDYERAIRYKNAYVEDEIRKVIETLHSTLQSAIRNEEQKLIQAQKRQEEQIQLFKEELSKKLTSVKDEVQRIKTETEEAKARAEKKAEMDYQAALQSWERSYRLSMEKWERAKADYQESYEISTRKKTELEGKISQLENEKSNLKGLFTGKRRKEIEENISTLKKTIEQIKTLDEPGPKPVQGPKPIKKEADTKGIVSKVNINDIIYTALVPPMSIEDIQNGFGKFLYDTNNQPQPIKWRVLEKKNDRALIITEMGIDAIRYHSKYEAVTWEKCTLRQWLNHDFLQNVFTKKELKMILETIVKAEKNSNYNTDPGNDTKDKVFLLSIDEAKKYFKTNRERLVKVTPYAKTHDAYEKDDYGSWWLRSPGNSSKSAAYVHTVGSVNEYGNSVLDSRNVVRPALWVKIR